MNEATTTRPLTLRDAESDMIELVRTEASIDATMAGAQKKITKIFDDIAVNIATLEEQKALLETRLKTFAHSISNQNESGEEIFPDGGKTLVLLGGEVAFNAGKPSIQFLDGYDEETTLRLIAEQELAGIIRNPDPELDKDAVMQKLTAGELTPAILTSVGLKRAQDATTLVKPTSIDKLRKASQKKAAKGASKK